MKLRYGNQIISLENIRRVFLRTSSVVFQYFGDEPETVVLAKSERHAQIALDLVFVAMKENKPTLEIKELA